MYDVSTKLDGIIANIVGEQNAYWAALLLRGTDEPLSDEQRDTLVDIVIDAKIPLLACGVMDRVSGASHARLEALRKISCL